MLQVNDTVLNNTFDGPAFLTWSRGQGTFGVGGPLPDYWIESQYALQVQHIIMLPLQHICTRCSICVPAAARISDYVQAKMTRRSAEYEWHPLQRESPDEADTRRSAA